MSNEPQDPGTDSEGIGGRSGSGPDFIAPGSPSYGGPAHQQPPQPGQVAPGQPLSGQPQPSQPQPSPPVGQPSAQQSYPPPEPRVVRPGRRRGRTRLLVEIIVGAVGLAVVAVLVVARVMVQDDPGASGSAPSGPTSSSPAASNPAPSSSAPSSSAPSSSAPSSSAPSSPAGGKQKGEGFRFTTPAGWSRSPDWGKSNDGRIVDTSGNEISVWIFSPGDVNHGEDPRKVCRTELDVLEIWVPGKISELPGRKVDGRNAPGGQLVGETTYRMRCVKRGSAIYNISLQTGNSDVEASFQAYDELLDSWTWT